MAIPINAGTAQQIICTEVQALPGAAVDFTTDPVLSELIPQYWDLYSDKENIADGLQMLYVKRAVLDYLSGQARKKMDVANGNNKIALSVLFRNLRSLRDDTNEELIRIEDLGRSIVVSYAPKPRGHSFDVRNGRDEYAGERKY